ncbi:hypothetical protein SB719_20210, partial [Pantoea sp. SIMBA_079]
MALDPILTAFVPTPPLPAEIDFPAWRALSEADGAALVELVAEPGPEVAEKRIVHIPVEGGTIALAIYRPSLDETLPAHLYF